MLLSYQSSFSCGIFSDMTIEPAYGVGKIILGKTLNNEFKTECAKNGLFFSSEITQGITSIIITNNEIKTRKGISVGDNLDYVIAKYGHAFPKNTAMMKGGVVVGEVGDMLSYNGIGFIINNSIISAIVIFPSTK